MEVDKYSENYILNICEFVNTMRYSGPTKNGLFYRIASIDELNELRNIFNDFFDAAEQVLKK